MLANAYETSYIYVNRLRSIGSIQNEIENPSFSLEKPQLAEIVELATFRSNREPSSRQGEPDLSESDFSHLLMAQDILGEQKELPEAFLAPLNATMLKVGKNISSKPRF